MVKTCASPKDKELTDSSIRNTDTDIEKLRLDLISCCEYETWDVADQKLLNGNPGKLLESFIATNYNYKRAFQSAVKFLSWKAKNDICQLRAESFPKEMHSVNFVSFLPSDINGTPVLLVRLCFPSPPKFLLPYTYKYLSWTIEKLTNTVRITSRKPRFIIDCTDARIELHIIKEMLNILVFTYPPWVESITFCNMNWKFSIIYSIIRKLLPPKIRELIVESDLTSCVKSLATNDDDLPPYLGGSAYNCSYDEYLKCPNQRDFLADHNFNEKQTNESIDYINSLLDKFGNNAPRKLI